MRYDKQIKTEASRGAASFCFWKKIKTPEACGG